MVERARSKAGLRSPANSSSPRGTRSSSRIRSSSSGGRAKSAPISALKDDDSSKKNKASKQVDGDLGDKKEKIVGKETGTDWLSYGLLGLLVFITVFYFPRSEEVNTSYVFYHGWITAISTGLGVLPFFFVTDPSKFVMGVSNAIAGGMMIAASYSLSYEGAAIKLDMGPYHDWITPGVAQILNTFISITGRSTDLYTGEEIDTTVVRCVLGFIIGVLFIILTQKVLEHHDDVKLGEIKGQSAQKMVLIIFVMTLHSLSEGIGIGVSFGGQESSGDLGRFISMSLAVHNIPEGLAVALVFVPRGVSKLQTGLWSVFTSLPQPLMAVPAYMFVQHFQPLQPVGLGFAAGAMAYVAIFELLKEAVDDAGWAVTAVVGGLACAAMVVVQEMLH